MDDSKKLFEAVYGNTKKTVYDHIAAKCFSLSNIDDIFQNTYVEVFKALERLSEPPPNEEAFVMLIANRQLAKYYSAVRRLKERIVSISERSRPEEPVDSFDLEDSLITRSTLEEIRELIESKPLLTRKAFFLHYRRDLTIAQTAQLLGISEEQVKGRIYRTLEQIRRKYSKEE